MQLLHPGSRLLWAKKTRPIRVCIVHDVLNAEEAPHGLTIRGHM